MENCPARANVPGADPGQLRRGKTVEEIYQKKTPLEHILLRPDTYVGSVEHQWQDMWIFDEARGTMVHRKIDYVPAMYKIFDEILVNAADNSMRDPKGMNLIDVTIDRHGGSISVMNNGQGVPVQMHQEHRCYVPELIFGHLLTSDNYNDSEKKVTGGRNGYGAKLANVFSKKFMVETADTKARKAFQQVFEANMSKKHPPTVTAYSGASEFTRVTFWPDLARFGMRTLDDDIVGLMMKRVYDIAGSTNKRVKVVLNGKTLPVRCFQDYVGMYLNQGDFKHEPVYERCSDRWEVAVSLTDGSFQQVSFVNSINTIKGGTHVAHVSDQLVEALLKVVKGKNRGGIDIKPAHVRNHLWIFINCLVENPAFDSQTKETLTTKQSKFGSTCELSEAMMKKVMKSGVVEMILDWVRAKQKVDMSRQLRGVTKNTTRVMGIPKLEDANDAGGRNSADCTLILTEGDSAKSLAVAGLSVIGRDKYGVFPLKGKVLNVRDANFKQVTGNTEIQNLLKIVGLDLKRQYDSVHGLRYGSIMVMTDQDHDGSHIKGLLINLIHFWWPSLAKMDGFLKQFITPIVKVWKDGKKDGERREETSFFTMDEYEKWKQQTGNARAWKSKYYKGLGTSTMKEAKEYFRDIEQHEKRFRWIGDRDGESIDLAFNKKRADDRKNWINAYEDGTNVDHSKSVVGYSDFIHKELVQFAKYDVSRSVPSVVDGFKPSQRKVIFCAFKKKLRNDIKVAQFVGYISEQSAYHHGEASLENTIVNLAQTFVGSNNANLLVPSGQFGTRLQGGKDHAAARYIYTRLHGATRSFFHPDDDHVLDYLNEEGLSIEPKWYCPVLPTVLMNGADGIGVGWSTFIPNHNPRDLIRNLRRMLRGMPMEEMHPWYKGFTGQILPSQKESGKYEVTGVAHKLSDTTVEVTELPVKTWTQSYKEFLEELMPQDGKKPSDDDDAGGHTIEEFREHHTESTVHFVLTLTPAKMREAEKAGFEKTFKLKTSIATSNMVLFDAGGKISKYSSALDILKEFCQVRHQMYLRRKGYLEARLTREKEILSNKARFILMVVKGELELRKKKKQDLLRELRQLGFTPMSQLDAIMKGKGGAGQSDAPPADGTARAAGAADDEPADDGERDEKKSEYDYLLGMNLWSLTFERVEEIKKQLEAKKEELRVLQETTIEQIWDGDLQALSAALDEVDAQEQEEAAQGAAAAASGAKRRRGAAGRAAAPAPPPPAPRGRPAAPPPDESFLRRPLVPVDPRQLAQGVEKTVWGVGEGAAAAGGAAPPEHPAPPQRRPPRQPGCPDPARDLPEAAAPAGEPVGGAGGGLLSRLLQKKGPSGGAASDAGRAPPGAPQEDLLAALGGGAAAGGPRPHGCRAAAGAAARRGRGGGRGRGRGRASGTESSGGEATEVMDLTGQPLRTGHTASAASATLAPPVLVSGFARRSLAGPALDRPQLLRRRGPAAGDAARPPAARPAAGAPAAGGGPPRAAAADAPGAAAGSGWHPSLGWFAQQAAAERPGAAAGSRPPPPRAGGAGGAGAVALDSDSDMEPLAARASSAAGPGRGEAAAGRAPLRPVAAARLPPAAAAGGPPRKRRRRAMLDDDDEDYEEHHAF